MKRFLKAAFLSIVNAGYGFVAFYVIPGLLLIAFNRTKGRGNNPDGELFMPIGWLLLVLIPILFFFMNRAIIKKFSSNKKAYAIVALSLFVGAVSGVVTTNASYYINYTNIIRALYP